MLLDDVNIDELWAMLEPHMDRPAWPGLDDPDLPVRARKRAKSNGTWGYLTRTLDTSRAIPSVPWSKYRNFKRGGRHVDDRSWMTGEVTRAAMAVWLDHPKAELDYLHDLLWAACETTTWVGSFHEYCGLLDLGSTTMAALYAEILYLLGDRMDAEVVDRVRSEVRTRVLDPGIDYRQTPWWSTAPMNWNLVCNGNLISTALYEIKDLFLAHYLHPIIQRLHYGLRGFAADGGCYEGPGYWEYAFSNYLKAAVVVHHRTGGKLSLMDDPKIEGVCRYPLVGQIDGDRRFMFCDCGPGYLGRMTADLINRFHDLPELYAYVAPTRRREQRAKSMWTWRNAAIEPKRRPRAKRDRRDHLLETLGMAKVRAADDESTVLGVLAAHNAVPHNHNDVGTFVYHRHGRDMITDPGGPRYNAMVFSDRRYEHPHCRTMGHSLPIVNGHEQAAGRERRGSLSAEGLNAGGPKRVTAEIADAYPDATLERLTRRFTLDPDGTLRLADRFVFSRKPRDVEEGFATYQPARVRRKGAEVVIGEDGDAVVLRAEGTPGAFSVSTWGPEAETWVTDEPLRRIAFHPDERARDMTLRFVCR